MASILETIVAHKRTELAERQAWCPLEAIRELAANQPPPRGFAAALAARAAAGPAVIAEVKRGSPSLGCLRPDLVAADQARAYADGGAAALSVLTDARFFYGGEGDFSAARETVSLPMLRKDFLIDVYQVYESRAIGADCVLLILAILDDRTAAHLADIARGLGMDVLVEAHVEAEVRRAAALFPDDLLGINNRNLKTFATDEATTLHLADLVPSRDRLVAESGLHGPESLRRYCTAGIRRFLIGTAFVKAADPCAAVRACADALLPDPQSAP